jgi:hypothetical protein
MGIDWDHVVLAPCMDQFANPVTITPVKSQPGAPPFTTRCVWEVMANTIIQEDGTELVTSRYVMGFRIAELPARLLAGDQATLDGLVYTLNDFVYDGQGGVRWNVKASAPGQETHYAAQ